MRKFLLLFAAASLSVVFAAGELSGRRAPGFALQDLNRNYHDIQDQRGKVTILYVMMTSCAHCLEVSKQLEKIKVKYGSRIAIMAIVNAASDNPQTVSRYLTANKFTTPVLFDCGQVTASYLKVTPERPSVTFPHVFLIDQQGMIRNDTGYSESSKGFLEGDRLSVELDKLLSPAATKKATK